MIERWVRFWDQREAPHSLALVRMLAGAVLFVDLALAGIWDVVPVVWAPPPVGAGWAGELASAPLAVRLFGASPETASALWLLALVACALFTVGFAYRVSSVALVFAMIELNALQPTGDAIDTLLRLVLPLLAVSGAGTCWSVDAWLRERRGDPPPALVSAWPRYLIFMQLVWLYFSAGHQRSATSWGPSGGFSAIGNVLGDPHFARFSPGSLAVIYPLTCLGTLMTMVFELSSPLVLLWTWLDYRPTRGGRFGALVRRLHVRQAWLLLGISLHSGIALSMKIGIFPFGMLALYPAFLHPSELSRALETLRPRLGAARLLLRKGERVED